MGLGCESGVTCAAGGCVIRAYGVSYASQLGHRAWAQCSDVTAHIADAVVAATALNARMAIDFTTRC